MGDKDKEQAQEIVELAKELPPAAADYIRGYMQGVLDGKKSA